MRHGIALLLLCLLSAVCPAFGARATGRSNSATLRYQFVQGAQFSVHIHQVFTLTTAPTFAVPGIRQTADLLADVQCSVVTRYSDGSALLRFRFAHVIVTAADVPQTYAGSGGPGSPLRYTQTLHIAADGRVLAGGQVSGTDPTNDAATLLNAVLFPELADTPVEVGQSWSAALPDLQSYLSSTVHPLLTGQVTARVQAIAGPFATIVTTSAGQLQFSLSGYAGRGTVTVADTARIDPTHGALLTRHRDLTVRMGNSPTGSAPALLLHVVDDVSPLANAAFHASTPTEQAAPPSPTPPAAPRVPLPRVLQTVTVGKVPSAFAVDAAAGRVFVTNNVSNSVSILDAGTGDIMRTCPVGKGPVGLAIDARTRRVFVANSQANTVSVLNLDTGSLLRTVAVGKNPTSVAVDSAVGHVLVVNGESDTVSVLDAQTGGLLHTTKVGVGPDHIAIDGVLHRALVVNTGDVFTAGNIQSLNPSQASVSIVDTKTGAVITTVDTGLGAFAVTIDGHLHIGIVGNENSAALIDLRTSLVDLTPMGSVFDVKVDARTDRAYLTTGLQAQRLTVLAVRTGAVLRAVSVGSTPTELALDTRTGLAYVIDFPLALNGPSTIAVVDMHTEQVVGHLPAGSDPDAIALDTVLGRVFVANQTGMSVTVIAETGPVP